MAQLGFRTIEEMIGRVDKLEVNPDVLHYKSRGLDLSALLTPATSLNDNHSGVTKGFEQVSCPLFVVSLFCFLRTDTAVRRAT